MEADKITVKKTNGDVTTHIDFRKEFDVAPLVFTLMDDNGAGSASFRVVNVSTTGFDIYTVEPDGGNGPHAKMTKIPYIAIEPGTHQFPDGTQVVAGTIQTTKFCMASNITCISSETAAGNFYPVNETTKNAYLHNSGNTDGGQVEGIDGFQLHPHRERHTVGWVFHLPQHTA